MKETFIQQSGKLSDLRQVSVDLCGRMYSRKFVDELKSQGKIKEKASFSKNNTMIALFIQEYIEIKENENGDIVWKAIDETPHHEYKFDFQSSFGLFRSVNRGEFGGSLITPKETLHGNFCEIFEFNGKVYAIDSLNHMSSGHIRIFEFDNTGDYEIKFKTNFNESISLSALTTEKERIYILVSGVKRGESGNFQDRKSCSYLFTITKDGFCELAKFDYNFCYVYNMLLKQNKMILGMDKIVAVVDIETKEITAYSPITINAEEDIKSIHKVTSI